MKIARVLGVAVICFAAFSLTACHTVKGPKNAGAEGTQAIGLGDELGFGGGEDSANRLRAPYNQVYHFDFDKFEVQQDDIASINAQGNYLVAHSTAKVRLEGDADERGSREYNIALGWKRAKAVADVLRGQGVASSQIAMVSFGKEKPVAFGHDEESYAKNRRVELVYESK